MEVAAGISCRGRFPFRSGSSAVPHQWDSPKLDNRKIMKKGTLHLTFDDFWYIFIYERMNTNKR
jgi:hypothetical protein